jgi:hypothetical protein
MGMTVVPTKEMAISHCQLRKGQQTPDEDIPR